METHIENARTTQPTPRPSGPILKQPTFDSMAPDKYYELNSFEIEVRNIFPINSYMQEKWKGANNNELAKLWRT